MFKIMNKKSHNYLIDLIPKYEHIIRTSCNSIPSYKFRTNCLKDSFFPPILNDWFNIAINIRNSESISLVKCRLLYFIRPVQNSVKNIFITKRLKSLNRIRLGLSHFHAHRFRHVFQHCLNPLFPCSLKTEDISHNFLCCHRFSNYRADLMDSTKSVCNKFES